MVWPLMAPLAIVLTLVIIRLLFASVVVDGNSMLPTLVHGDRVIVFKLFPVRWLRRRMIVVLDGGTQFHMDALLIKRVIGLPGDTITSGVRVWYVPYGHCFLQGDSPGLDSTVVGPFNMRLFYGVALFRLPRARHDNEVGHVR